MEDGDDELDQEKTRGKTELGSRAEIGDIGGAGRDKLDRFYIMLRVPYDQKTI